MRTPLAILFIFVALLMGACAPSLATPANTPPQARQAPATGEGKDDTALEPLDACRRPDDVVGYELVVVGGGGGERPVNHVMLENLPGAAPGGGAIPGGDFAPTNLSYNIVHGFAWSAGYFSRASTLYLAFATAVRYGGEAPCLLKYLIVGSDPSTLLSDWEGEMVLNDQAILGEGSLLFVLDRVSTRRTGSTTTVTLGLRPLLALRTGGWPQ